MSAEAQCIHNQRDRLWDIALVVGAVVLVLMLREGVGWFWRTHELQEHMRALHTRMTALDRHVRRWGTLPYDVNAPVKILL